MEKEAKEVLGLKRIPSKRGDMYIYPEYLNLYSKMEDIFINPALGSQKLLGDSTRGVFLIQPRDKRAPFVVKKERRKDCDYSKEFIKYENGFFYPEDGNLIIREISVARALSKLATHDFEDFGVYFEKPIGYFQEKAGGKRLGYFKYEEIENPVTSQNLHNNLLAQAIMASNGVLHLDAQSEFLSYYDADLGKEKIFVTDFEFVEYLSKDTIDDKVMELVKDRGMVPSVGPAFEHISYIKNLKDPKKLLEN